MQNEKMGSMDERWLPPQCQYQPCDIAPMRQYQPCDIAPTFYLAPMHQHRPCDIAPTFYLSPMRQHQHCHLTPMRQLQPCDGCLLACLLHVFCAFPCPVEKALFSQIFTLDINLLTGTNLSLPLGPQIHHFYHHATTLSQQCCNLVAAAQRHISAIGATVLHIWSPQRFLILTLLHTVLLSPHDTATQNLSRRSPRMVCQ